MILILFSFSFFTLIFILNDGEQDKVHEKQIKRSDLYEYTCILVVFRLDYAKPEYGNPTLNSTHHIWSVCE